METTDLPALERIMKKVRENGEDLNHKNQTSKKILIPQTSYKCLKCKDTGWIIGQDNKTLTRCKCDQLDILKRQWKNRGINPEETDRTFKNFKVWNNSSKIAKATAAAYYKKFDNIRKAKRNSILFCGQVGSGKTHLSIALALNFIKKGINVTYMPYRDVITDLKQNMLDVCYYKSQMDNFQSTDVLLIDDLFKGKVTESDINIMFEIINHRYLNKLPIIVSTEFVTDRMLNFDEGVGSRIYEMCKDFIVQIEGKENNYRLRN